jgi:hypothetical protein
VGAAVQLVVGRPTEESLLSLGLESGAAHAVCAAWPATVHWRKTPAKSPPVAVQSSDVGFKRVPDAFDRAEAKFNAFNNHEIPKWRHWRGLVMQAEELLEQATALLLASKESGESLNESDSIIIAESNGLVSRLKDKHANIKRKRDEIISWMDENEEKYSLFAGAFGLWYRLQGGASDE